MHGLGEPWQAQAIAALGRPGFADRLLAALAKVAHADMCSAFAWRPSGQLRMVFAGGQALRGPQFPVAASQLYASGCWRADPAMAMLAGVATGPAMLRQRWDVIPSGEYRRFCYERPKVVERILLSGPAGPERIFVGLYRTQQSGAFDAADLARIEDVVPVLTVLAAKQGELDSTAHRLRPDTAMLGQHIAQMEPGLSAREVEVCAALLSGQTAKEAAISTGLQLSTVITYRKRAFAKLDVATRQDLVRYYERGCRALPG